MDFGHYRLIWVRTMGVFYKIVVSSPEKVVKTTFWVPPTSPTPCQRHKLQISGNLVFSNHLGPELMENHSENW